MAFEPVKTLSDLDTLSEADMVEGYTSAERGDPEPGDNRGRAFWHGWRCRMMDFGQIKPDPDHHQLACAWVARERAKKEIP